MENYKSRLFSKLKQGLRVGKKIIAMSLIGGSLFMLSACGAKKAANVKVSNGCYVQEYGHSTQSGKGYLALKVNVKNTTGQEISVSDSDFKLKKGDKTISAEDSLSIDGLNDIGYQKLDKDESVSGYVFFKVDKKDKYDLKFTPKSTDYDSSKDDNLKASTTEVNASKYKDPGQSAKNAAKQYVEAVFLNDKSAQDNNNLENNVKEEAKQYHDDFVKGFRETIDKDAITDQQADKVFQDYVSDGAKRDEISYKIYEAAPNKVTIEVIAKTVNISDIDFDKLMSDFEKDFINKHKDDVDVDEEQVEKEAGQYVIDKLPELISKQEISTDSNSGYQIQLQKKDGKWEVVTTGSDSDSYSSLRNQFLAGIASSY